MMSANITDQPRKSRSSSNDLHFFITSLFSYDFFYDLNIAFDEKIEHELKWWYPELLCEFNEKVNLFELFKRRMIAGYKKYGEKIGSIIVILPSNFNDTHIDVNIDPIYGDKIVVLTRKLAKLYYIISQVLENSKFNFIGEKQVNVIFLRKDSFIAETYKVQNNLFEFNERLEKNVSLKEAAITIKSLLHYLNIKKDVNFFTVIFVDDQMIGDINGFDEDNYFVIDRKRLTDNNILLKGAIFKAKNDYEENILSIVGETKKLPRFDVVYDLLNPASDYRPISEAFGIDLGTSRSALAIHHFHDNEYHLEMIPEASDTSRLLYSWITFEKDPPIYGKHAFDRSKTKEKYTVYDIKKLIGKRYSEIEVDTKWPFKVLNDNENVKIQVKNHLNEKVKYASEDIYALFLGRLKSNAKEFRKPDIKRAIFTIPSSFSQRQKRATRKAAKIANIEVMRFLPEPTAAALSFCSRLENKPENGSNIFVFDLGGGTTDFSIFYVKNNKLCELCQESNQSIGGSNFTNVLYEYFKEEFLKQGYDIDKKKKVHELRVLSMVAKEHLSVDLKSNAIIESAEIDVDITRVEFETLANHLIEELRNSIKKALNKAKLEACDINTVIKVGGSCVMPMINELLEKTFTKAIQEGSDHEREVVLGAALYAASILPQKPETPFIKNHWPLY